MNNLAGAKTKAELEEVGTVLTVGDGVARIYGLTQAQAGELLEFENGLKGMVLNLEEDNVGAVLMGESKGIHEGDTVEAPVKLLPLKLAMVCLVVWLIRLGDPIDGKGPIQW